MRRIGLGLLALLSFFCILCLDNFSLADSPPPATAAAVMIDPASPRMALLKQIHLLVSEVDQVSAALDPARYRVAIIDGTPANLTALQQHAKEIDRFTNAGGWVMLWGVTPEGLPTFNQLVGVDHIMRPFRMERVSASASPSVLSAGIVSSDLAMESQKRTPEPASVNFLSGNAWSYVVDLDDIARFCQLPSPAYWGNSQAMIGWDNWPENMLNGVDDYWRFSFTITLSNPKHLTWPISLPRKETIDGFSIERESIFDRITKVHLSFPGTDAKPVDLGITQDTIQQFDFPPVLTDVVQMTIETDGKNKQNTGIRNLRLKIRRSADFQARVRPLASIGVLVAYIRNHGPGGIVLNEMNVAAVEEIPANGVRRRTILNALLRNLGAPFDPATPIPLRKVEWLQKGADWNEPANWSTGQVPGRGDIACFPAAHNSVADVNPNISSTAQVGGVEFDDDYGGPPAKPPLAAGVKPLPQPSPSWMISGSGPLSIGRGGIDLLGHAGSDIINCNLLLTDSQTWHIGGHHWDPNVLILDQYGNPFDLVLTGKIGGNGAWAKEGTGRVYYASNAPPTFTGGLTVRGAAVEWALTKLEAGGSYRFGTGPITLDCGSFCFGANNTPSKDTVEISNPIFVTPSNGMLEISAEGIGKANPPLASYTGSVNLSGNLKLAHSTIGWGTSGLDLAGPVRLDQSAPRTLGLASGDFVTGWNVYPILRGDVHDGPGAAGNPLVLRSLLNTFVIAGTHSDYAGDTVIDTCGSRLFGGSAVAVVEAGPGATLGDGEILIQPGGHLNLTDATNIAPGKSITLYSDAANLSVLGLKYDGIPTISPHSTGVIAIETQKFDAISSLEKIGDGTLRLGTFNGGEFTGKTLAPGAGNLYRLGGGGSSRFRNSGSLIIHEPVLNGSAGVEVGSTAWWGVGNVVLEGANTFTGPLTVQSPPPVGEAFNFVTSLTGIAQPTPGANPLGSAQGPVLLDDAMLQLTGVKGGQPVAKGTLTVEGHSAILLDSSTGPANLTFGDVQRQGQSVLTLESPATNSLGITGQMHVGSWNQGRAVVDPNVLCMQGDTNPATVDFASYDPKSGVRPFAAYVTDIAKVHSDDVLCLGATALTGQTVHVKDLKATGPITGTGKFLLSGGGLLATGAFQPDVDFGNAEGVIFGPCNLLGKVSGKRGLTFTEHMNVGREQSALVNTANDFTGTLTLDSSVIDLCFDSQGADGKDVSGSLGNLNNNIALNGGFIHRVGSGPQSELAASRTITLGPSGGGFYLWGAPSPQTHIRARLTGPGVLTQFVEDGPGLTIDNPGNDFAGGTKVCAGRNTGMTVSALGKLGVGPVQVDPESQLILQGDANIDPHARLEIGLGGITRCFSGEPRFGSLTGAGVVYLDGKTGTSLTIGSDDSDFTFFGSIIEEGAAPAAVTKTGTGIWTLYGAQHYTGATTVAAGTLDLRGSIAGNLTVAADGTLRDHGIVAGDLEFQPHSTLDLSPRVAELMGSGLQVAGKIQLDPTVVIRISPKDVVKMDILTAKGGITGDLPAAPKGCKLTLSAGKTTLELTKV
jgi:autotransporter-associated beta strand protein